MKFLKYIGQFKGILKYNGENTVKEEQLTLSAIKSAVSDSPKRF